jgi:hypothetical protein
MVDALKNITGFPVAADNFQGVVDMAVAERNNFFRLIIQTKPVQDV